MSRRQDVILLLGSLHDDLPALGSSLKPTTGMAANARKPCPDCGHTETPGWRVDVFRRRRPCLSCGGTLEPKAKRGRGWVHYDPMDVLERPVQTETQAAPPTRAARMVGCDGCGGYPDRAGSGVKGKTLDEGGEERDVVCPQCGGSGWRAVTRFDLELDRERADRVDRVTEAVEARTEAGSYHELDQALALLPGRWRKVVYDVHVNRLVDAGELCDVEAFRLEATMRLLEHVMPARVKVPGAVRAAEKRREQHLRTVRGRGTAPAALAVRDKEIRRLVRIGRPVQWVAAEYGVSVRQVYRVVKGESEAA